jgi:hypothetical protein
MTTTAIEFNAAKDFALRQVRTERITDESILVQFVGVFEKQYGGLRASVFVPERGAVEFIDIPDEMVKEWAA